MAVHYLETGSTDCYYNLAFEEYILRNHTEGDYLLLWQNDNTIVIGQNQNAEAEINRSFVEEKGIHVVRRSTGGGAVYHDLGNLNYSFITDAGNAEELAMSRFTIPVVEALKGLGLDAESSGRNDILVSGKKVSGTAQRLAGGRILHHGTLLFDSNPEMVSGALNVDPTKFRSKSSKSVRARIGNIRSFLQTDMELSAFWDYLKQALSRDGFHQEQLTETELAEILKLRNEKYDTWDWNFGRSPKFEFNNKQRFACGSVEVGAHIEKGIIQEIRFYGDFLSVTSLDKLERALAGLPFHREAVEPVICSFDLNLLFGGITADEILDVMFHVGDGETEKE